MQNNDPIVACLCVLQVVQEVVNPDAKIEYRENTADDPKCRKPDITKVLHRLTLGVRMGDET